MASPISANVSSTDSTAKAAQQIQSASKAAKPLEQAPQPTTLKSDTVKLSLSAQIRSLRHQGVSTSQIASRLGISAKQLASYIPGGIAANQTASPAPTAPVKASSADATGTSAPDGDEKAAASLPAATGSNANAETASPAASAPAPKVAVPTSDGLKADIPATK